MLPAYTGHKSVTDKLKLTLMVALIPSFLSSFLFLGFSLTTKVRAESTNDVPTGKDVAQESASESTSRARVLGQSDSKASPTPTPQEIADTSELETKLAKITANKEGTTYSISIIDIKAAHLFGQQMDHQTHAASVMKLLVAVAVFKEIEAGNLTLSSPLGGSTVENHLRRMINRSDNTSWDVFNKKLGYKKLQSVANDIGFTSTKLSGNIGSSSDFAFLLYELYSGSLISDEHRQLLYGFMQHTENESMLSLGIENSVTFYHKTGYYDGGRHDAMIVDVPERPYIITVMSSNPKGVIRDRAPIFKEISETVLEFFQNKKS